MDVIRMMKQFNEEHNIDRKVCVKYNDDNEVITMVARVVVAKHKFTEKYQSLESRTYEFSNYNKALTSDDLGYSIFAENPYDNDLLRMEDYTNDDIEQAEIIKVVI